MCCAFDRVTWRKSAFATLSDERTNQREELKMIPLVLILAVTAALTLVIVIAARRSPSNVSRSGDTRSSSTYISSDFGGYDSSGADCSDASGGGDCGGGDGGGGGGGRLAFVGDGGDGGHGTSFNSEKRRHGGKELINGRWSGHRVRRCRRARGGRSIDAPRTQAAGEIRVQLVSVGRRLIARPGRWPGRHRPLTGDR